MGRGRQKAKQTKVARELKYHREDIDVTALARELSGAAPAAPPVVEEDDEDEVDYTSYSAVDDDDDGPYVPRRTARR